MRRQFLDVHHGETVPGEYSADDSEGEVRKVFVVDRVELVMLDESEQVRKLHGHQTVSLEHLLEAAHKTVEVRHMGEDVVGDQQIGSPAGFCETAGHRFSKELSKSRNTGCLRSHRDIARRFHTEHGDMPSLEELQQVTIVAGDLDDHTFGGEPEALNHFRSVCFDVFQPSRGVGREVGVIVEDLGRRLDGRNLHERAQLADVDLKRIEWLTLREISWS